MKKISKFLVIVAAVVAMVFVGCTNNGGGTPDSGSPSNPGTDGSPSGGTVDPFSGIEDVESYVLVLGKYGSVTDGILEFKTGQKGSYTPPANSTNIRAAEAIQSFDWKAEKSGSIIKITIKYKKGSADKTGTLKKDGGIISGKLDDSDDSSAINDLSFDVATIEKQLKNTSWEIYFPDKTVMDKKLTDRKIDFYVSESKTYVSNSQYKIDFVGRHLDPSSGKSIVEREYKGVDLSIVESGPNTGSATISTEGYGDYSANMKLADDMIFAEYSEKGGKGFLVMKKK